MKEKITIYAKGIIYFMAASLFAVCAILLPELAREEAMGNPNVGPAIPFLIIAWILAIPIFIALYQTLKLLKYIDIGKAFSERSIKALQNIKLCAIIFSIILIGLAIIAITIAEITDPPIMLVSFIITFITSVIYLFAAVLQRLIQNAIDMQKENELTV